MMKNEPDEIQFDCPQCQRPMSGDRALLAEMINCPDCNAPFVPKPRELDPKNFSSRTPELIAAAASLNAAQIANLESRSAEAMARRVGKIRRLAKNFTWASAGLACFAVLMLFVTVVSWHGETSERTVGVPEDHIGTASNDCWHITTWCVYAALLLFAVGQIVHIRANTEK